MDRGRGGAAVGITRMHGLPAFAVVATLTTLAAPPWLPDPIMSLSDFLQRLREAPEQIEFAETIALVDSLYGYTPTAFRNGEVMNAAGQNAGSCKVFSFARLQGLTPSETLACFGRYYREDVLQHPEGSDHQNIRNFMRSGWDGVQFEAEALHPR